MDEKAFTRKGNDAGKKVKLGRHGNRSQSLGSCKGMRQTVPARCERRSYISLGNLHVGIRKLK